MVIVIMFSKPTRHALPIVRQTSPTAPIRAVQETQMHQIMVQAPVVARVPEEARPVPEVEVVAEAVAEEAVAAEEPEAPAVKAEEAVQVVAEEAAQARHNQLQHQRFCRH